MLSLVFLCARKVVSDHASTRRSLEFVPKELYPVLFKAAFIDEKTLVLQDLVQNWPFSVLCFQKLLFTDRPRNSALLKEKPSKLCVQTVILGVMAYLNEALAKEGKSNRKRQLRLLDMTGIQDDGLEQDADTMSLWSRTVTLAKACIDISRRHCEEVVQISKRRRGYSATTLALPVPCSSIFVEVRVDLFVNSTSYGVLREALNVSTSSPLRLLCRDFRAEELSLRSTTGLLELLNTTGVRQIDLRFNNLGLSGLNILLPLMTKFSNLQSLKLPYSNVDVRRLSPAMEEELQNFASQLGQLSALKELNLGSSRLSGRLRQLLGALQKPLESLELAFCYLLPVDVYYLCQSIHVSSLKKLDLSGNNLTQVLLQPFQQLLTKVSQCLLHLDIMECKLTDTELSAIIPALCHCSQLRYLGFFCNPVSSQGLRMLLQSSVLLSELQLVVYPFPVDCYDDSMASPNSPSSYSDSAFDQEKLAQIGAEVQQTLVLFGKTDVVWTTDMYVPRTFDYLNL
ncbi:leucine-rich repeat-containing protein 14 [Bombina bombina]|uniref:leucine-rich repeat-containing protein 14 n=1 Tax=Bombina bombina TaxID=8345 RepID=UPI00235AE8B5|nr:leucine-rich repeat-containing protein 14 [Bombina bombina]